MNVISTSYTLNTKWLEHLSSDFGTKLENDKLLPVPECIGNGFFYYVEVMPGFFILLINISQTSNFKIDRHPCEDEVFIFHYDLSDEIILFKAKEKLNKIGYKVNLGFTLIDGNIPNYIEPTINSNVFALRFVISKSLLYSYTGDKFISKKNKHICFHNHIDSKSILHIKTLKEKTIFDDSFELYLKGVGIEVFAIFVKRYSSNKSDSYRFLQIEVDEIAKTKDYLLNSLHNSFPGVLFLAGMAGMSETKYKLLFKKIYLTSPKKFFTREKMLMANKLLTSGFYNSLSEILFELNYSNLNSFIIQYHSIFDKKPSEDFKKKASPLM